MCTASGVLFSDIQCAAGSGNCGKNDYQPLLAMECLKLATDPVSLAVHLIKQRLKVIHRLPCSAN